MSSRLNLNFTLRFEPFLTLPPPLLPNLHLQKQIRKYLQSDQKYHPLTYHHQNLLDLLRSGMSKLIVLLSFLVVAKHFYASAASLNLASASLFPGFLSGWYFNASFLYAFFISDSLDPLDTPNMS